MLRELLLQAFGALRRSPLRSLLTLLGIAWGIACVALLAAYGSSLRSIMLDAFDAMGRSVGVDAYVAKFNAAVLADTLRPLLSA